MAGTTSTVADRTNISGICTGGIGYSLGRQRDRIGAGQYGLRLPSDGTVDPRLNDRFEFRQQVRPGPLTGPGD